jgi:hypothetical protein
LRFAFPAVICISPRPRLGNSCWVLRGSDSLSGPASTVQDTQPEWTNVNAVNGSSITAVCVPSCPEIQRILGDLEGVDIEVYEPTAKYQNVAKRTDVEELTPARVLIAEMIRRYWVLGIECTYLEVQKLGWFLERTIHALGIEDPLKLHFKADKYGPYSDRLRHLLNALDGTYLHCDKRLNDAGPADTIWFDEAGENI